MNTKTVPASREIVFIDSSVEDYVSLATGVRPGVEVRILDAAEDGIRQIGEYLKTRPNLKAIHLVSHGSAGCVYLGNSQLNSETVDNYRGELENWSAEDLLLYGCNVAAGNSANFLRQLSRVTGAKVAASASPTGNASLGGDWKLDVRSGKISASLAFESATLQAYRGILERLFAVKDEGNNSNTIVELNPTTGEEINSFPAPEEFSAGFQGLAFDGNSLFFINDDEGFNRGLWELDPDTGEVRDNDPIPVAGTLNGLAVLGGQVYILDGSNSDIIGFNPVSDSITHVWDLLGDDWPDSIDFFGLAGITKPNALILWDGYSVMEINLRTGEITDSFNTSSGGEGVAVIDNEIYVGSGPIDVYDRTGQFQRTVDLTYPVTALGGDDLTFRPPAEPNDTPEQAIPTDIMVHNDGGWSDGIFTHRTFSYSGEIGDNPNVAPEEDIDLYQFDVDSGDIENVVFLYVRLLDENGYPVNNINVRVIDEMGYDVGDWHWDGYGYGEFYPWETGTFYFEISGDGTNTGNYNFTVETLSREMGEFYAGELYLSSGSWSSDTQGLYNLDTETGAANAIVGSHNYGEIDSLAPSENSNVLYGSQYDNSNLFQINVDGSDVTDNYNFYWWINGLAYDPTNDILYASDGEEFFTLKYTIDPVTGDSIPQPVSLLDPPTQNDFYYFDWFESLAFGNGGVYGLDTSGELFFYDPSVNNWSYMGLTGVSGESGLAFDAGKNVLYAKSYWDTSLYEIDPFDDYYWEPETTVIGDTGIEGNGGLAWAADRLYAEPNDTLSRAINTGLTRTHHGTFTYSGAIGDNTNIWLGHDVDLLKFDLDLGETVRLPATVEVWSHDSYPPYYSSYSSLAEVRLFDVAGIEILGDSIIPDPDNPDYILYTTDQAGTFYVGISAEGNQNYSPYEEGSGDGWSDEIGTYDLTIETMGRQMGGYDTGKLYFSNDDYYGDAGLYSLDMATGEATFIGSSSILYSDDGSRSLAPGETSNLLYGGHYDGVFTIHADGSGVHPSLDEGNGSYPTCEGLAYDATNDILYAYGWAEIAGQNSDFFTVNPDTGNPIASLNSPPSNVSGLAFGNGGGKHRPFGTGKPVALAATGDLAG